MALEDQFILMEVIMKVNGNKVKKMEMENYYLLVEADFLVSTKIINLKDLENCFGNQEIDMKENSSKIK